MTSMPFTCFVIRATANYCNEQGDLYLCFLLQQRKICSKMSWQKKISYFNCSIDYFLWCKLLQKMYQHVNDDNSINTV